MTWSRSLTGAGAAEHHRERVRQVRNVRRRRPDIGGEGLAEYVDRVKVVVVVGGFRLCCRVGGGHAQAVPDFLEQHREPVEIVLRRSRRAGIGIPLKADFESGRDIHAGVVEVSFLGGRQVAEQRLGHIEFAVAGRRWVHEPVDFSRPIE